MAVAVIVVAATGWTMAVILIEPRAPASGSIRMTALGLFNADGAGR